jgi:hypothetical protein
MNAKTQLIHLSGNRKMKKKISLVTIVCIVLSIFSAHSEEIKLEDYRGVVTFHLIPAKVMKINRIIENPKPGSSYIGDEGILVEIDENLSVMANWSVVNIKYYKYPDPKIIRYSILSEQRKISVHYRAVSVEIDGDLSTYIQK